MANSKINSGDVLKGAAAVTVAAGVVAAGVLLSDKKNRKKAGKMAVKGMKMAKEMARDIGDEASSKYQTVQTEMPIIKGKLAAGEKKLQEKRKKNKTSS